MSIMRGRKNLVKVLLKGVLVWVDIVLEVRLHRGKLSKNIQRRVEVGSWRVLEIWRVCGWSIESSGKFANCPFLSHESHFKA